MVTKTRLSFFDGNCSNYYKDYLLRVDKSKGFGYPL